MNKNDKNNEQSKHEHTEHEHHCVGCTLEHELKVHAPFTLIGTFSGAILMGLVIWLKLSHDTSHNLFMIFHPLHVFFSAMTTSAVYYLHNKKCSILKLLVIGYLGSIGVATLSDCIIPFIGEKMLGMPNPGLHLGFIHLWWLVNPLAVAGIFVARFFPTTKFPHLFHVLISTWASLFHVTMAMGNSISTATFILVTIFLFIAVWVPCCTSDIIFPLMFTKDEKNK
jgi:hypothetical protein